MEMKLVKDGAILKGYYAGMYVGGFDFRTNTWEVVRKGSGKRANMPYGFNTNMSASRDTDKNLYECAYMLIQLWDDVNSYEWRYDEEQVSYSYAFLERLASLGLYPSSFWELTHMIDRKDVELKKDFVQYLREVGNGHFSIALWERYKKESELKDLIVEFGSSLVDYVEDCVQGIEELNCKKVIKKLCQIYKREHVYELMENNYTAIKNGLREYVELHPEELVPSRNFLLELATARKVYKDNKERFLEKHLREYNNLDCLYYETDEWFARPLITPAMFHDEAERQGNCVERLYMDRVAKGDTHVVQIRSKRNPNASWITVEVMNTGKVFQFLLRFNRRIENGSVEEKIKTEYSEYLAKKWGE